MWFKRFSFHAGTVGRHTRKVINKSISFRRQLVQCCCDEYDAIPKFHISLNYVWAMWEVNNVIILNAMYPFCNWCYRNAYLVSFYNKGKRTDWDHLHFLSKTQAQTYSPSQSNSAVPRHGIILLLLCHNLIKLLLNECTTSSLHTVLLLSGTNRLGQLAQCIVWE